MSNKPDEKPDDEPPGKKPAEKPDTPAPVPYERFAEVNKKASELEKRLAEIEDAQKKATDAQLAEQNKWKELAEKREQELTDERLSRLRLKVALDNELPTDIADRLVGKDDAELRADAERLKALLKPAEGPGNPRPGRSGRAAVLNIRDMTPAQIREKKAELLQQRGAAN